jgi:hypothetical protein
MTSEMRAVCAQTTMPTVSSRVEQRVVRQVVVGLADEAWRGRLPLALKLQLHAREKLGECQR